MILQLRPASRGAHAETRPVASLQLTEAPRARFPKLFIVGEGAGIVAPEFMTDLPGSEGRAGCNGIASFCNSPVENDPEKRE